MSYDPKVWTSEKPERPGKYWVSNRCERGRWPSACDFGFPTKSDNWDADYDIRSVHAIPSAAEIAALVECAEVLGELVVDYDDRGTRLSGYAALARLDEARKEQGK